MVYTGPQMWSLLLQVLTTVHKSRYPEMINKQQKQQQQQNDYNKNKTVFA